MEDRYVRIGSIDYMIHCSLIQLIALGKTKDEICDILQISRSTLRDYEKKYGIDVPRKVDQKLQGKTVMQFKEDYHRIGSVQGVALDWGVSKPYLALWLKKQGIESAKQLKGGLRV